MFLLIICRFSGLKRKKISQASFDSDVAEGVLDIGKLSGNMETEVDKLRQEYRNCITTRISPGICINGILLKSEVLWILTAFHILIFTTPPPCHKKKIFSSPSVTFSSPLL
jgi:hypothetical protein